MVFLTLQLLSGSFGGRRCPVVPKRALSGHSAVNMQMFHWSESFGLAVLKWSPTKFTESLDSVFAALACSAP